MPMPSLRTIGLTNSCDRISLVFLHQVSLRSRKDIHCAGLRDRKCVSVPVSKSDNSVRYGHSVASDASRINLTYDELLEIVCFDLNNSFFTVGTFVGKQTCGIPMGSPISPALAVIVCAYYENKIFKAVNDWGWSNTNTIMGTRGKPILL